MNKIVSPKAEKNTQNAKPTQTNKT